MVEKTKPVQQNPDAPAREKKSTVELSEKQLDTVTGGKSCVKGEHIKEATITP